MGANIKRLSIDFYLQNENERFIYNRLQETKKEIPISWHVKNMLLKGLKEEQNVYESVQQMDTEI